MKIIIISTIRNESDILETFVRYHLQLVDHMIIINHRSMDSSAKILNGLQQEGLSLEVEDESALDHQQGSVLTRYMRRAVRKYNADWVVPLDADEFLTVSGEGLVRKVMEKFPIDKVVKLQWRTYIPTASDNCQEPNILKRIQHYRRNENHTLDKIMIPRSLALKNSGLISPGNHGFVKKFSLKQKDFPYEYTDQLVLAHYPARSAQQIMTKAVVGWLACLSKPNKEPTEAFHLKQIYGHIKNGNLISPEELSSMAMGYATATASAPPLEKDLVHMPIKFEAGHFPLHYVNTSTVNHFSVLAQMAEEFAEALGALRRKQQRSAYDYFALLRRWLRFRRN